MTKVQTFFNKVLNFFVNHLQNALCGSIFAALEPPSLFIMLKSGVVLFLMPMSIAFEKRFCSRSGNELSALCNHADGSIFGRGVCSQ